MFPCILEEWIQTWCNNNKYNACLNEDRNGDSADEEWHEFD